MAAFTEQQKTEFSMQKWYDLSGKTPSNNWLTKDEDIVKFYYNEPRCTFRCTEQHNK